MGTEYDKIVYNIRMGVIHTARELENEIKEILKDPDIDEYDKRKAINLGILNNVKIKDRSIPIPQGITMRKGKNETFWRTVGESNPSDIINITPGQIQALMNLWSFYDGRDPYNMESYLSFPPVDLIMSDTLPLKDVIIQEVMDTGEKTWYIQDRVIIYDCEDRIATMTPDGQECQIVGLITIKNMSKPEAEYGVYMTHIKGANHLTIGNDFAIRNASQKYISDKYDALDKICYGLIAWYTTMVALLHPSVKEVFKTDGGEKIKLQKSERIGCNKNKIYRYVKRKVIVSENLEKMVVKDGEKYTKKVPAWHVIGHYRTYKNGKKVWVAPYWKGALRETKTAETINREIVIDEL